MKKVFFDTEFTGLHQNTSLISIGCISDEGHTFYATLKDYSYEGIDEWIVDNVLANLLYTEDDRDFGVIDDTDANGRRSQRYYGITTPKCKDLLLKWLQRSGDDIVMWSDCLAYDWVLFCQLFGGAMEVPSFINYIPRDICTLFEVKGVDPDISRVEFAGIKEIRHNALADAILIKACYEKLEGNQQNEGMALCIEIPNLKPLDPITVFDIPPEKYDDVHSVIADKLAKDIGKSLNSHETLLWMNDEFDISIKSE